MTEHQNYSDAVWNLQRYLRQLALIEEGAVLPPVDGIFDDATEQALRQYQKSAGMSETGIADAPTWESLYADYRVSLSKNSPPVFVSLFPFEPFGFAYEKDSRGFTVAAIQYMLRELSREHGERLAIDVTGIYGEETQNAVAAFQDSVGITPNGVTDLLTWNSLADSFNLLVARFFRE